MSYPRPKGQGLLPRGLTPPTPYGVGIHTLGLVIRKDREGILTSWDFKDLELFLWSMHRMDTNPIRETITYKRSVINEQKCYYERVGIRSG